MTATLGSYSIDLHVLARTTPDGGDIPIANAGLEIPIVIGRADRDGDAVVSAEGSFNIVVADTLRKMAQELDPQ